MPHICIAIHEICCKKILHIKDQTFRQYFFRKKPTKQLIIKLSFKGINVIILKWTKCQSHGLYTTVSEQNTEAATPPVQPVYAEQS